MDYEKGLERLKQSAKDTDWCNDFTLYEARLRENLNTGKRYGSTEQLRSDRAQIIHQLNQLANKRLGTSFNDLCLIDTQHTTPDQSVPDPAEEGTPIQRQSAFICYSRKDTRYLEELQAQLAYHVRAGVIDYWEDTKILPGTQWRDEINNAIQRARIAILLISSDFFASDFIMQDELPLLVSAADEKKLTIYCVILRPSLFNDTEIARFQAINEPSDPLSTLSQSKREKVWVKVAGLVKKSLSTGP
jgi:TIR domain